jgi:hypothetical protein
MSRFFDNLKAKIKSKPVLFSGNLKSMTQLDHMIDDHAVYQMDFSGTITYKHSLLGNLMAYMPPDPVQLQFIDADKDNATHRIEHEASTSKSMATFHLVQIDKPDARTLFRKTGRMIIHDHQFNMDHDQLDDDGKRYIRLLESDYKLA